jgi:hypothetical protein
LYWGGSGGWVKEPSEAFHFPTVPEAVKGAGDCGGPEEVEVALKLEEGEIDVDLGACRFF